VDTIKDALDEVPPEIVSDLIEGGICMAGGTSQVQGFPDRLSDELKLRVWVAEDPMTCVARGAGLILEDLDMYKDFLVPLDRSGTRK
jgi:rod shape-determining protein MreB